MVSSRAFLTALQLAFLAALLPALLAELSFPAIDLL